MTMSRESLQEAYGKTLGSHLAKANEAALHQAYQLGRQALSDGFGVLDLVLLHHEMLAILGHDETHAAKQQKLDRAAEFLAESLSPFEMSLRGYRDANASLAVLNATLSRAKAATDAANRELESFSYSVAHDLRAPLRSIDGFSQALLEDYADKLDKDGQQHLHYVRQSAQEMTKLIDGLLSLSHVTRCELRHERVDLSDLAHGIIAHLRRSAPTRSVETTVQHDIVVEGDRRLLRVVLENLIGNAWKFTQNRITGHIEFGAVGRGSHQVCFVRDNGAGFDMTYTAKLFGVFQRLHAATEFEGTGIGLATVHRIVTRHGGRVWAEGEVERGATFYFTLGDAPPDAGGTAS